MITEAANLPHISVCVCTYKRPQMLSHLLSKLQEQVTNDQFTYSAVVVDNDANQSARDAVVDWQSKSIIQIEYFCEPRQNIAHARNKAVANAKGDLIAFIDDDEFPEKTWLTNLLSSQKKYNASGVLGPVKPYFETMPPSWIVKGKICERRSFTTGTIIRNSNDTRTGNVLFLREIFNDQAEPFNPKFGLTGGEDVDFFSRMILRDFGFVWCDEAGAYEIVPRERLKRKYYIRRALLRGSVNASKSRFFSLRMAKSTIAFIAYTAALPVLLCAGQHHFMNYLIKDCDHIGLLLGLLGFNVVSRR